MEIKWNNKILQNLFFFEFTFIFCVIFLRVFVDFYVSFRYFLKRASAQKFPSTLTEYFAYNSGPSVGSIKLKTIIETKMGQNGRRSKCAIFY